MRTNNIIGDWSRLNDMEVNKKKSAIMFVTKRRFKQKKGTEHYPETDSYRHLGTLINRKGSLTKHVKSATMSMVRTATALMRIKNDKVPPKRLTQLFFILSKAVLDYPGPILHLQDKGIKTKFSRLSYKTIRMILGLRKSSPIKVIHQICGPPEEEWERRNLYYSLGLQDRRNNSRYLELIESKLKRAELRKRLQWPTIRLACITANAKGICTDCGNESITPAHIATHLNNERELFQHMLQLINETDSVSKLADLDQKKLQDLWIYYKKTFKFKKNKKQPGTKRT